MCGIVGGITERRITPILMEGLKRLEYRGYDSMGFALLDDSGEIFSKRSVGRIQSLRQKIESTSLTAGTGIAHTRWATHGVPSERNAHPHISRSSIAVVHNGIVENYQDLRQELESQGYLFTSDTDTEVIAHLIQAFTEDHLPLAEAVRSATDKIDGHYAIGVISRKNPDRVVAAKKGSPLVIGFGEGETFLASDVSALTQETDRFTYLEDGDVAILTHGGVKIFDREDQEVIRAVTFIEVDERADGLSGHDHYMHLEIHQQPRVLRETLKSLTGSTPSPFSFLTRDFIQQLTAIKIVACGTSFHAGLVARHWFESLARLPCDVEVASEFRYRDSVVSPGTLFTTVSQSGETADTIAALKAARSRGFLASLGICNVPTSSLMRLSNFSIQTKAGHEIGVASTKAFTAQLVALLGLVLRLARLRQTLPEESLNSIDREMNSIESLVQRTLDLETIITRWGYAIARTRQAIILGRGSMYPIALEGALKLKETSYIQVDAYPAGELKHGPLALIDSAMPVIAMVPHTPIAAKLMSNLEEVNARGGLLFIFADERVTIPMNLSDQVIHLPAVSEVLAPILYAIPLQLLAYHAAVASGTDVDKPRNLAKSVTVE